MKKKNDGVEGALKIKQLKESFRHVIEKYLVEHECTTTEAITLISMALYDIFKSIAATEDKTHDEVLGAFVKSFGVWDYLKTMKEG